MKSAIVIGGSGFIGSHVADKLSEKGFNVTIFDCFETKWKLKEQKFILGNILDKKALENAIKGNQIVYNFAAIADLNKLTKNPIDSINVNNVCIFLDSNHSSRGEANKREANTRLEFIYKSIV